MVAIYFQHNFLKKLQSLEKKTKKKRKAGPLKIPNIFLLKMYADGFDYSLASPPRIKASSSCWKDGISKEPPPEGTCSPSKEAQALLGFTTASLKAENSKGQTFAIQPFFILTALFT